MKIDTFRASTEKPILTEDEVVFANRNHVHVDCNFEGRGRRYALSNPKGKMLFRESTTWVDKVWAPTESAEAVLTREDLFGTHGLVPSISPALGSQHSASPGLSQSGSQDSDVDKRDSDSNLSAENSPKSDSDSVLNDLSDSSNDADPVKGAGSPVGSIEGAGVSTATGAAENLRGPALQSFLQKALHCKHARFYGVDFTDVDLGGTNYSGATFEQCVLHRTAVANAVLKEARFKGAHLIGFTLQDLKQLVDKGADLRGAIIESDELDGSSSNLDLSQVQFKGGTFKGSIKKWNLSGASFEGCKFTAMTMTDVLAPNAHFVSCTFTKFVLDNVVMPFAQLHQCYADGYDCRGGDMEGVKYDACTMKWPRLMSNHKNARFWEFNIYDVDGQLRVPKWGERTAYALEIGGGSDATVDFTGVIFTNSDLTRADFGYGTLIDGLQINGPNKTCGMSISLNRSFLMNGVEHVCQPGNVPARPIASLAKRPKEYVDKTLRATPTARPTKFQNLSALVFGAGVVSVSHFTDYARPRSK